MKIKVFDSKTLRNIIEINLELVTKIQNECIIGRSPESGIVLDSADVSRMHGKLVLENENYYFCDLGSRNGSLINGKIAETSCKYLLNPGDTIRLGEFVLILEDISSQPDNSAETVYRGLDATVVASLRDGADVNQDYYNYQAPVVNQVPEVVAHEEPVTESEEATTYQETTQVQQSEISVPEEVIETPEETLQIESQIAEAVNEAVGLTETANALENTNHNQLEEITSTLEAPPELIVSEEINEIADAITVIPTSATLDLLSTEDTENTVTTNEETLEYSNTLELDNLEEVAAIETPVVQANEVSEEAIIQPRGEIQITETSEINNILSSQEDEIPEQEIFEQNEPLVSNYQALETTNDVPMQLEEAEPVIPVSETTCSLQQRRTEEIAEEKIPEKSKIISTKYIALLAHDSKRFEIAQFAAKHQEFFSNCLIIAPPSVSEILSSQAGITTTEQTSATTSGGYQAIAAKVASGDILAVIFLRDFLQVQSNVANEEAMLRVCNINEVMIATNLPTAEAIVSYIQRI